MTNVTNGDVGHDDVISFHEKPLPDASTVLVVESNIFVEWPLLTGMRKDKTISKMPSANILYLRIGWNPLMECQRLTTLKKNGTVVQLLHAIF